MEIEQPVSFGCYWSRLQTTLHNLSEDGQVNSFPYESIFFFVGGRNHGTSLVGLLGGLNEFSAKHIIVNKRQELLSAFAF